MQQSRTFVIQLTCLLFSIASFAGNLTITPTTTLAQQTSSNTSAASIFANQSNGNLGASNISKVDIHSLLYPGAETQIYAHLVLWFGKSNHMNVGYSSADPAQVQRQITDMISRGINGVVMDWFGPGNFADDAAKTVMREAEAHPGFTFALMIDKGAIKQFSCARCTPQQKLAQLLQYLEQTYFPSPAYLRLHGQPVVTDFDIDAQFKLNWKTAAKSLAETPAFLFQNNSGFTHTLSHGAYSWIMPTTHDYGIGYLNSFYDTGVRFDKEESWGSVYKGFNDKLASWSAHRTMQQRCGETWLQTFAAINSRYDSLHQLPAMQLVTWNDYEEGSEMETGIDNCASISATISGQNLQWKLSGDKKTIDHYTVYVSQEDKQLMELAEPAVDSRSLDLCSYSFAPGNYNLYVQAVGKPMLVNHMSRAVAFKSDCPVSAASLVLSASPSAVMVHANQAGHSNIRVSGTGKSGSTVSFSCIGLPANMSCSFSPAKVNLASGGAGSVLTIGSSGDFASLNGGDNPPSLFAFATGLPLAGLVIAGNMDKKRILRMLALAGALIFALLFTSCGGGAIGGNSASSLGRSSYQIVINAASDSGNSSMPITINVQ